MQQQQAAQRKTDINYAETADWIPFTSLIWKGRTELKQNKRNERSCMVFALGSSTTSIWIERILKLIFRVTEGLLQHKIFPVCCIVRYYFFNYECKWFYY